MLNIGSYMGGVNLWQNEFEHDDDFNDQSMHDKILEVVCVSGAWHLGKLQVWRVSLCFHFYLFINSNICFCLCCLLCKLSWTMVDNLKYHLSSSSYIICMIGF